MVSRFMYTNWTHQEPLSGETDWCNTSAALEINGKDIGFNRVAALQASYWFFQSSRYRFPLEDFLSVFDPADADKEISSVP